MKKIFYFFCFIFIHLSYAQKPIVEKEVVFKKKTTSIKIKRLKKEANQYMENNSPYSAINAYQRILSSSSNKKKFLKKINYQLANAYFKVRDYENARKYYREVIILDKKGKLDLAVFNYANSLKYLALYKEARHQYRNFITITANNNKNDKERNKAYLEMKGCLYAIENDSVVADFNIQKLFKQINGVNSDNGPAIRDEELFFSKILESENQNDGRNNHFKRIYSSSILNDDFSISEKFSSVINDRNKSVFAPSFTANGDEVYFTKCDIINNKEENCAIYYSHLENGVWTKAILLDENINEEGSSTKDPQIVVDENSQPILFFSAKREKGRGGYDLYYSVKNESGKFSRARNLGYPINTSYDEISPFYHVESQSLYFSTNGKVSLGGFDIYKSQKVDGVFREANHLAPPINSSLDDYDFIINKQETTAFLASNRNSDTESKSATCCDDIYRLNTTIIDLYVKGLVYFEKNGERKLLDSVQLELSNDTSIVAVINCESGAFIYPLKIDENYHLKVLSDTYENDEVQFNTEGIQSSDTLQYDLFLKEKTNIIVEDKVVLNAFSEEIIGVIYYSFNAARLTEDAPKTLNNIIDYLKANPKVIVEISAHTDDVGAAAYNMQLSKERCFAAANYLMFYGISENRINKKWYGEEHPIVPNKNPDGSDNLIGRERNRRTEFKAVGEL